MDAPSELGAKRRMREVGVKCFAKTTLTRTCGAASPASGRGECGAVRKLSHLDAAHTLEFLRSPPGNQLEALKHDRVGQHSIRINRRWRLCFVWTKAGPENVEIVDYH